MQLKVEVFLHYLRYCNNTFELQVLKEKAIVFQPQQTALQQILQIKYCIHFKDKGCVTSVLQLAASHYGC